MSRSKLNKKFAMPRTVVFLQTDHYNLALHGIFLQPNLVVIRAESVRGGGQLQRHIIISLPVHLCTWSPPPAWTLRDTIAACMGRVGEQLSIVAGRVRAHLHNSAVCCRVTSETQPWFGTSAASCDVHSVMLGAATPCTIDTTAPAPLCSPVASNHAMLPSDLAPSIWTRRVCVTSAGGCKGGVAGPAYLGWAKDDRQVALVETKAHKPKGSCVFVGTATAKPNCNK